MLHTLTVYTAADCWTCAETERLLALVAAQFPDLRLQRVDAGQAPLPEDVFAVPTYLLDGKIISLGNPTQEALQQRLAALF